MEIAFIAFTEKGLALAQRLAQGLEQQGHRTSVTCGFGSHKVHHDRWAQQQFEKAGALVFIGATGIAVRTIAPLLRGKGSDPAVIVLDELGENCIPLVSGHLGGANKLAKTLSDYCGARAVITTASDMNGVFAVDSWARSQGLIIPETTGIKLITSSLLKGKNVECATAFPIVGTPPRGVNIIPIHSAFDNSDCPRFHVGCRVDAVADLDIIVPVAVLGVGCRKGTTAERIEESVALFLEQSGVHPASLCCVASIDLKAKEPGLVEFAEKHGLPFVTFDAAVLNQQEGDFSTSDFVSSVTGTTCVCERAAVAAGEILLTRKTVINGITFAIALKDPHLSWDYEEKNEFGTHGFADKVNANGSATIHAANASANVGNAPESTDPASATCATACSGNAASTCGRLSVVGLGPGDPAFMSQEAVATLKNADVLCGYHVYIDLAKQVAPETPVFTTPMTKEIDRCRAALDMAASGKNVAMVCSGDAGVYGMAGLCFELEHEFGSVDIRVIPGITAALSGASQLGAPLTHDFCVISLSDLLTPWELIKQRLQAAARADFCVALYNPASHRRTDYLQKACDIMLDNGKSPQTICGVVRNIGRTGQETWIGTLQELRTFSADMFCTAFVGNRSTLVINGKMVTPRGYQKKSQWNKNADTVCSATATDTANPNTNAHFAASETAASAPSTTGVPDVAGVPDAACTPGATGENGAEGSR